MLFDLFQDDEKVHELEHARGITLYIRVILEQDLARDCIYEDCAKIRIPRDDVALDAFRGWLGRRWRLGLSLLGGHGAEAKTSGEQAREYKTCVWSVVRHILEP